MTIALDQALAELGLDIPGLDPKARIQPGRIEGRTVWIKTAEFPERRLLWNRKGDPQRAFDREREALTALQGRGLPVVRIIAASPRVMVLEDCGPPVTELLTDPGQDDAELAQVLHCAGAALGRLHRAGISHGRAAPNDFCWRDGQITLIDFEYQRGGQGRAASLRADVYKLVYKLNRMLLGLPRDYPPARRRAMTAAVAAGYRSTGPEPAWRDAVDWCRRNRVWLPLVRALWWPRDRWRKVPAMTESFAQFIAAEG